MTPADGLRSRATERIFYREHAEAAVAVIHHTDCGSGLLADDELRHGYAQRIGVDERTLTDTAALDPARTVRTDVQRVP